MFGHITLTFPWLPGKATLMGVTEDIWESLGSSSALKRAALLAKDRTKCSLSI